jgi:hypothetical protein
MDENPYESPRTESTLKFTDEATSSELERRVDKLERRLARSWLMGPLHKRITIIWVYLLVGYVAVLAVVLPIVWLIEWLFDPLWAH